MAHDLDPDHFESEAQADLFGVDSVPPYRPDADRIRARLERILAEARAAEALPWDAGRASLYRTIFPQMTLWLPEDEGAQYRLEFETEMERLQPAEDCAS